MLSNFVLHVGKEPSFSKQTRLDSIILYLYVNTKRNINKGRYSQISKTDCNRDIWQSNTGNDLNHGLVSLTSGTIIGSQFRLITVRL